MAKAHFWLTFDFRNWTPYIIFLYWRENYNWVEHLLCRSFFYANYSVPQFNIFLGVSMSTKASDGERSYAVNFHKANTICCPLETAPIYYCYFLYSTGILSVKLFSFDGTILVLNVTNRDKIERLLPPLSNGRCIGFFWPQVDVMFCALKGRISYSWRNYQHLYIFFITASFNAL